MPSVDWRKVETALFALQISHQTGPFSFDSDLRSSHVGLEDEALVQKLVGEMGLSLNRLKENWESVPAVATLIMVTARLLSLTKGASIQICLSVLSSCRHTCFKWLQTLRDKVSSTRDTIPLQSLTRRILQAALVCTQCYDIDATYLDLTLRDSEALSQFIQCSIAIQECYGKHEDDTKQAEKSFLDCLILRYRRHLFRTKKILMSQITSQGNKGLDSAIAKIWPSFSRSRGDQWIEQASCWLKTTTSNQDGTVKVPVHYNVITAELLVKGLPLGRLPPKYEAHKDYTILFGRSSVDVMPSAEAGMRFSTRCSIQGHQIHLCYGSHHNDLRVRACKEDTLWELVPSRLFEQHFPEPFHISQDAARTIYAKLSGLPIINPKQAGVPKLSFDSMWVGNVWPHLREAWGGIQKAFEKRNPDDHFLLFSWMVSVAFAMDINESTLSVLLGLMFYPQNRLMAFPQNCGLNLEEGHQVDLVWLRSCIESHYIEFGQSTMLKQVQQLPGEPLRDAFQRTESLFKRQRKEFASSLEKHVHQLWPRAISDPGNVAAGQTYLTVSKAMQAIRARCKSWHSNLLFLQSLEQVSANLRCIILSPTILGPIDRTPPLPAARNVDRYIQINDLFALTNTLEISGRDFVVEPPNIVIQTESSNEACLVSALGSRIANLAKLPQEGHYVEQLAGSIHQLGQNIDQSCLTVKGRELHQVLSEYYQSCQTQYSTLLEQIKKISVMHSLPQRQYVFHAHG